MSREARHALEQEQAEHAKTRRTLDMVLEERKTEKDKAREACEASSSSFDVEKAEVQAEVAPLQPVDERLANAAVMLLDLNSRNRELEQQFKVMREDRDRLLTAKAPEFFVVWNPRGPSSPRITHDSHAEARDAAITMANRYPGSTFFVLAEAGNAEAQDAEWHCDQAQYAEELPF